MTQKPVTPYGAPAPTKPPTIGSTLVMIGVLAGFLIFISYPIATSLALISVIGAWLGAKRYVKKRAEQTNNEEQELHIPGVATIEYRFTPQ